MARFYQTQYIPTKSAYVPLPYEAMAAKLQSMQAQQDQYKQNIELLDKPFGALPVDMEGAVAERERTRKQLEELRNLDYNDTANRQKIFDTIRDVRESYDPQGAKGLYQARLDQYNAARKHIQDTYKDNPTQMQVLMNRLDNQFRDPNDPDKLDYSKAMRQNPETGEWENTGINSPKEWTWVDREKWASDTLKDIEFDQDYQNYGFSNVQGMQSAIKAFREGNVQHKDYDKIQKAMIMRARGNPQLLESTKAEGEYFNYGDQSNWLLQDEKGNIQLNPDSLLGQTIMGTVYGGKFRRESANTEFVKDTLADDKAKMDYEKKLKEADDFVLRGNLPVDKISSTTITKQAETINSLKTKLGELKGKTDAASVVERERLQGQLNVATSRYKLMTDEALVQEGTKEWKDIVASRKEPGNKSDPFEILMNTKEANEKIKTEKDYIAWLRGDITLGLNSFHTPGGVFSYSGIQSEENIRQSKKLYILTHAEEFEIASNETLLYGNKGSALANTSEALAAFVQTTPSDFVTSDGSMTLATWQQEISGNLNSAVTSGKKVQMHTHPTTSGGFAVSYTDELGNPIEGVGVKIFQASGTNTNREVQNIIGNDLVRLGSTGDRPTDKQNVRLGQVMIANSGNAGGAFKKEDLYIKAESIPDASVKKGETKETYTNLKSITTPNGEVRVRVKITKFVDSTGTVVTTYKPIDDKGYNIFYGNEHGSKNGSFVDIDDMNIALEKDVNGIGENELLMNKKPTK